MRRQVLVNVASLLTVVGGLALHTLNVGTQQPTPPLQGSPIIPQARLVKWEPGTTVGVPGGIPPGRVQCVTTECQALETAPADLKNGSTNAAPLLQAAVSSAPADSVVLIPVGTWRMDAPLNVSHTKDAITVRGAAGGVTLDCRAVTCVFVGASNDYLWAYPASGNAVTAFAPDAQTGGTKLTIADTGPFAVNQIVNVRVTNDTALPVISVAGFEYMRGQITRIAAKNATSLTVYPAIYGYERFATLQGRVNAARQQTDFIGIEDLTIDGSNGVVRFGIWFAQTYGSWVKNVRVRRTSSYHVFLNDSLQCELRHSRLDDLNHTGPRGAGLLLAGVSGCLIEDNVITESFPNILLNGPSSGNVIAYNFVNNKSGLIGIDTNHSPHNSFNLYEGNVAHNLLSDGYFGSNSEDTIYRNLLHGNGIADGGSLTYCLSLKRFSRNFSVVGNILGSPKHTDRCDAYGQPNIGNATWSGTAQPSKGDYWDDWRPTTGTTIRGTLTVRTDDFHGGITLSSGKLTSGQSPALWLAGGTAPFTWVNVGSVTQRQVAVDSSSWQTKLPPLDTPLRIEPGSGGYQELDLDVEATTLKKANAYMPAGIPPGESLGGETLPPSLYLPAKPVWFGSLSWPPFDPNAPNLNYEAIPAGYRFMRGVDAPGTGTSAPPVPTHLRIVR